MAVMISKLALHLKERPEVAFELLVKEGFISAKGLSHRNEILSLLEDTQKNVSAAEAARSKDYFEITGPQPTAGFQFLANVLESRGFLSPAGLTLHNGDD